MKKTLVCILFSATASVLLAAQSVPPVVTSQMKCDKEEPAYNSWYQQTTLPHGEPYLATDEHKQHILENYRKLKLQMALDEVEKILGKPDFGTVRSPLRLATAPDPTDGHCHVDLAYIVRKTSSDILDKEDVAVFLSFGRDGKLYWAVPQNLPGLKQLGSAAATR
jgi:hypothetical protein